MSEDFTIIGARDVIRRRPAMYLGADVRYGQPTKSELLTEDARPAVAAVARAALAAWSEANPDALAAVRAQAAAQPARRR